MFLFGFYCGGVALQMFRLSQAPFPLPDCFATGLLWPWHVYVWVRAERRRGGSNGRA